MRKIETLFIGISLIAIVAVTSGAIWHAQKPHRMVTQTFPTTQYGAFLAAQHAIYINDFNAAAQYANTLEMTEYPIVQNTKLISDFLNGRMPTDAKLLKGEKSMPAQIIYDAYLIQNGDWKGLHNRHKTDTSALSAPLRIWSAIANDWRTNTFKFIDELPTNESWKSFVRGQIYAELGNVDEAAKHFAKVSTDFMNINDYLYIMSFYTHHNMSEMAESLRIDFTTKPGGMFMMDFDTVPDWSMYSGYENALAFSLVQNVSHTQVMMYSDLAMLLLRFAQITSPEFGQKNDAIHYYLGQFFYNNVGDYQSHFDKISTDSPFYLFATLRGAEKSGDMSKLKTVLERYPLFVPAINEIVAHYIQHGDKRAALRIIDNALKHDGINDTGRAFFLKSRAQIKYVFGDLDSAQQDLRDASNMLFVDGEILMLQAKIWAAQNRELDNAYEYAMALVKQNPTDVLAWDTLGAVVAASEGPYAAIEILERVGEVSATCSSLFARLGDLYVEIGQVNKARDAYKRAIDLSDDGLTVAPNIERKLRKIK